MTENHRSITRGLEAAWRTLQRVTPDLPVATILTGSGNGPPVDLDDPPIIFVSESTMDFGPIATLSAVAHEAVHLLAQLRGISDTSDRGRYHNTSFAKLAAHLGFVYDSEPGIPLRETRWGTARLRPDPEFMHQQARPGTPSKIDFRFLLGELGKVLPADHPNPPIPMCRARRVERNTKTDRVKATCLCTPPRIIYLAPSVLRQGEIVCLNCTNEFQVR